MVYEITTIAGPQQVFQVIEVEDDGIRSLKGGSIDKLATHAFRAFQRTGLDGAIRQYPSVSLPERLRLVYDAFPTSVSVPLLRVWPTGGQISVVNFDFAKAELP